MVSCLQKSSYENIKLFKTLWLVFTKEYLRKHQIVLNLVVSCLQKSTYENIKLFKTLGLVVYKGVLTKTSNCLKPCG